MPFAKYFSLPEMPLENTAKDQSVTIQVILAINH